MKGGVSSSAEKSLGLWGTVRCTGATLGLAVFGTVGAGTAKNAVCLHWKKITLEKNNTLLFTLT